MEVSDFRGVAPDRTVPWMTWIFTFLSCILSWGQESSLVDHTEVVIDRINGRIREGWADAQVQPSVRATDGEWCRRVYLNVLGRIPSVDELRAFTADRSKTKRERLVDRLLYDEEYRTEYAFHWASIWMNLLIGRTGGTEARSLTSRDGLMQYLVASFEMNKPYDQMVSELVTATGTTRPGGPDFNGAANFLAMKLEDNAVQATAKTSQLFLGTQIQCTQCHDHPFNHWKQNQFWELNSFFRQTVALRRFVRNSNEIRDVELTDQDFAGEGNHPQEAEVYFEQRNGILRVAYPVFLDGNPLANRSGYLQAVHRRQELAAMIQESPLLERTIVNRMWKHFFGVGFTNPVDDFGPHRPVSHPELLDELAREFRDQGFDLKQLIRWLALSEPHALSSRRASGKDVDDVEQGAMPRFQRYYDRQMSPEELYASVQMLTDPDYLKTSINDRVASRAVWLQQFFTALGNDEAEETSLFNGTIPQSLILFNGEQTRRAITGQSDNWFSRVVLTARTQAEQLDYLFLAALARTPHPSEKQLVNRVVRTYLYPVSADAPNESWKHPPQTEALRDIFWALINSSEFQLNH